MVGQWHIVGLRRPGANACVFARPRPGNNPSMVQGPRQISLYGTLSPTPKHFHRGISSAAHRCRGRGGSRNFQLAKASHNPLGGWVGHAQNVGGTPVSLASAPPGAMAPSHASLPLPRYATVVGISRPIVFNTLCQRGSRLLKDKNRIVISSFVL